MRNRCSYAGLVSAYFSVYLAGTKNVSTNTIYSYRDTFVIFHGYLEKYCGLKLEKMLFNDLSRELILEFLQYLETERKYSISSRNQRLAALKSFAKYVQIECPDEMILCQRILSIDSKKAAKPTVQYLSNQQTDILMEQPDISTPKGRRDLAMILLLYDSAARVQELCDLRICDIRIDSLPVVHLLGKGRKSRDVPLTKPCAQVLRQYICENHLDIPERRNDQLFTNPQGKKLTRSGVSYVLAKYIHKANTAVDVKDASDAHKNGQTLVFENARVLPVPEKPGDKVSKIGVGIYKQDREALTYLPGAVYELYTVDDIYSADGTELLDAGAKLAESSPTNESGITWFDVDIPIRAKTYPDSGNSGRYRIVEITAPAGYLLDSTPMEVSFTYEGQQIAWQVVDATNTNLRTSVDISKQDITNGKELPGAKLEIRDADGNLVEGWTSGKVPHTVRGLELEKEYTLTEKHAPDGYAEAERIVFKLVQNGTEQVNEVYEKSDDAWVKLDDATVIMQDAPVLDIDKTDIAGNLLPGATLTICDADGEAIDTWVTDYKTHRVPISDEFIKLSDDSKEYIYTLTEDAAPAGFEIAESVQFKIQQADENVCLFVRESADAEWVRADKRLIQMIDEATPREDTPTPQPTPAATPAPTPVPTPVITPHKVQTLPQTGDGFPLLAIVVVSLASATGIVLLTVRQKNALKETSDEEDADESSDR